MVDNFLKNNDFVLTDFFDRYKIITTASDITCVIREISLGKKNHIFNLKICCTDLRILSLNFAFYILCRPNSVQVKNKRK